MQVYYALYDDELWDIGMELPLQEGQKVYFIAGDNPSYGGSIAITNSTGTILAIDDGYPMDRFVSEFEISRGKAIAKHRDKCYRATSYQQTFSTESSDVIALDPGSYALVTAESGYEYRVSSILATFPTKIKCDNLIFSPFWEWSVQRF